MASIEKAKELMSAVLKNNINKSLLRKYDWKVSRSVSTDESLSDTDIKYRAGRVALYNKRLEQLSSAETLEEVNSISVKF
jgi:hypothetical protein